YVEARAKRLRGAKVLFDLPTVTGTENLVMAAAVADGRTVLENCAREPEVCALAKVLVRMGARIEGAGTSVITIDGVRELRPVEVDVIPDRIEAGTLLCAALATGGNVLVKGALEGGLDSALGKFREAGAAITSGDGGLRLKAHGRPEEVDLVIAQIP